MDLRKQIEVAQSQSFSKMSGVYLCPELSMPAVRPGADDHQEHPSRRNNKLIYKDGREVKVQLAPPLHTIISKSADHTQLGHQ
jgi:hypothetical protein